MKTLVIIGHHEQAEVQLVMQKALQMGHKVAIFNTQTLPDHANIDYLPHAQTGNLVVYGQRIPFNDISGIYWAQLLPPQTQQEPNKANAELINYESSCLLQLLLSQAHINWVNSLQAIQFHRIKPQQLGLAKQLGACIPETYVGNQHHQISLFLKAYPKSIIKPVHTGGLTVLLTTQQHELAHIAQWAKYAVTLQQYIPGENVRTYVVNNWTVSGRIVTPECSDHGDVSDYRGATKHEFVPITLPIGIQQLAVRICHAMHMVFTAIDWRLKSDGSYVFLEANPAPMFAFAQAQLGVEIDTEIVKHLTA
ncbi:MAG: hypothetical protein WA981_11330 [Glaciecola sp.]